MTEREVPVIFADLKEKAKKPGVMNKGEWETGMAVVKTLFEEGRPTSVVKGSVLEADFPNAYNVKGATVEFMPHWGYVGVDTGKERKLFSLDSSRLPAEKVVANVKKNIKELTD